MALTDKTQAAAAAKADRPVLETENLGIVFGGLHAVEDVHFSLKREQIMGLIGPNGAGKTTVFNLLTGVYTPTTGQIMLEGESLLGKKTYQITKLGIARTFQNIRLWKSMTVFDNVIIAKHMRAKHNVFSSTFRISRKEEARMREETEALLREQGLWQHRDALATGLPYGLQRRLEIARALATEPKLLLLDEPAAGMNPQETLELADFIHEIRDKHHLTILLIEHHMDLVMNISDRIYVLDFGSLIAQGLPSEIQKNQHVIDAYLGVVEDE